MKLFTLWERGMKISLLLLPFLLCGCGLFGVRPVVAVPKEVSVAVAQKCIDRKDVPETPQFPLDTVQLTDDAPLARLANAARLERKVRTAYVAKVEEVLKKCSD
jgi:hypothetical protein